MVSGNWIAMHELRRGAPNISNTAENSERRLPGAPATAHARRFDFGNFHCWGFVALVTMSLVYGLSSAARAADDKATAADKTTAAAIKAANSLYDNVRTEVLPNGLHIYLNPVPSSPVVTTMVAYRVGSSDEDQDNTGLSHYLEHLMFKGTDKIMPGQIDHITLTNGGQNNAYTTENFTIFHFDFASDRWATRGTCRSKPIECAPNLRTSTRSMSSSRKKGR